jgi:hypothetical protein
MEAKVAMGKPRPKPRPEIKKLRAAFEYATDFVLSETSCPTVEAISNGYCDRWAWAVKKRAPFVEVRERDGHYFVVYDGVAYDSDKTEGGFEPF